MKGNVTKTGYWPDSPDRNNDFNIIPSNEITMEGMDMPLMGVSNTGDKKLMLPGKNYKFKGETVMETPLDKGIFLGAYKQVGGQLVPHDISVPNLSRQEGGSSYDIPAQSYRDPNVVREEGREWYDPASETIHMQPSYPNVIHEQMVKGHELDHHKQKLKGKLSSTEYWPGPLKEPALGASDEMTYSYYNRAGQDIRNLMNAAPQSTFFGIPEDVAVTGFQNKTYDTPGTAEYEAEHPDTPRTVYRGKPVVKNAIAKTLGKEEKDPEMMFKNKYNTELTKEEQKEFDKWAEEESKKQGRDILMDKGAYDVQGFWKSGDWNRKDGDNHGTDTWKKPNHPTFSNQSKYHGAGGWYGGNWTEDVGYQPSKQTLNTYEPYYYDWLFGEEPNRPEYLDMSRYDGTNLPTPIVYQNGGSLIKAQSEDELNYFTSSKKLNDEKNRISEMRSNVVPISLSHDATSDNRPFNVRLPEGQPYCTTRACEVEREAGFPIKQVASGYKLMNEATPENGWYPTSYDQLLPGDMAQVVRNSGFGHTMISTGNASNMPEQFRGNADPNQKGFYWDNGSGQDFQFASPKSEDHLAGWMDNVKKMNYYTYKGNLPQYEKEYSSAVNNYLHDTSEGDYGPMAPIDAIPRKKKGGNTKRVIIKSLPKNWKTQ